MINQPPLYNIREQISQSTVVYLYDFQFSKSFDISVNGVDMVNTNRIHLTNAGRVIHLTNAPVPGSPGSWWAFGDDTVDFEVSNISHKGLTMTAEGSPQGASVSLASSAVDAIRAFFIDSPNVRVKMTIIRTNLLPTDHSGALYIGDVDFNDCFVSYQGFLTNISFQGQTIGCTVLPEFYQNNKQCPRYYWQRLCNRVLYSANCGATPIEEVGAIAAIDYATRRIDVVIPLPFDNFWQGGQILLPDDPLMGERYSIQYCGGIDGYVNLYLTTWSGWIEKQFALASTVRVQAGCDHTIGANGCAKYSNQANFGGFNSIPIQNLSVDGGK